MICIDPDIQALLEKIDEDSPFLAFDSTGQVQGVFRWIKEEDDSFDPETKCYRVCLEMNGKKKTMKTKSIRFIKALAAANVQKGDTIKIIKTGSLMQTRYTIEVINIPDTMNEVAPDVPF